MIWKVQLSIPNFNCEQYNIIILGTKANLLLHNMLNIWFPVTFWTILKIPQWHNKWLWFVWKTNSKRMPQGVDIFKMKQVLGLQN